MPLTKRNRRKKQNNNKDTNGNRRSINDLPDNVLSNIVSLLPMKDAVRTSILSKRWEFMWTTIPELSFIQETEDTTIFMNFIKRALSLRGSSKITEFQLKGKMDASCSVQPLFPSVAQCNVEVFRLHLDHIKEALSLPISLLNSATLTDIHIRMKGQKLMLPFLIYLPSLKLMNLWGITIPNQYSAQNLFSGCPVLENLQIVDCSWLNVKAVKVLSSKLQKLRIREARGRRQQNGRNRIEFEIQGSGLRNFSHEGLLYFDYSIVNPALLLEEVSIYVDSIRQASMPMSNSLLNLLRSIMHVPTLKLGLYTVSLLFGIPEAVEVPMFMGIRVLELDHRSSDFSNARLFKILENTPCLESLIFREGLAMPSNPIEDGILDPVPSCFLNRLNYVFVHVFYGYSMDLEGIKIILKNAMVLKKMEILLGLSVTPAMRNEFPLQLLKLPRASKDCGIFIV
ncbi:hypothetical protein K1719_005462 [Acacia pycnantha]|nr:hypothetical protein K1719_005462 [Acacia pycnantha]